MRPTKLAIADALRTDPAVGELVPAAQVFSVEHATVPTLPSIEVIGISSERVGDGPMVRHELSVEVTVSHQTADGADEALDAIVRAVRQRLGAAEDSIEPISLAGGEGVLVVVHGTRWSVSANDQASVIRGASLSVNAEVSE